MTWNRPPSRPIALSALVVLVALATSSCGGSVGRSAVGAAPAATVADRDISRADLDRQIEIQRAYDKASAKVQGAQPADLASIDEAFQGAGRDTVPTSRSAQALTTLVQIEILREAVDRAGGSVTDADRAEAREQVEQQSDPTGQGQPDLPKRWVDQQVEFGALQAALRRTIEVPRDQLEAAYRQRVPDFTRLCVSVLLVADQATAEVARQRVLAGEAFAEVASEVSIDEQTRASGGEAGCAATADIAGQLGNGIYEARVNEPLEPVQLPAGWVVTVITARQVPELADIEEQLLPELQVPLVGELVQPLVDEVDIDPRYGTWDVEQALVVEPTSSTATTIPAMTIPETLPEVEDPAGG